VSFGHAGFKRERPPMMGQSFLDLSKLLEGQSDVVMRRSIGWLDGERLAIVDDGQRRTAARAQRICKDKKRAGVRRPRGQRVTAGSCRGGRRAQPSSRAAGQE
jgi:hypothetical protein